MCHKCDRLLTVTLSTIPIFQTQSSIKIGDTGLMWASSRHSLPSHLVTEKCGE